jgi:hypothetical protein
MRVSASLLITLLASLSVVVCSGCSSTYKPTGAKLPDGFQINCYPQSVCTRADSTPLPGNQTQQIVVLISNDDVPKIVAWYKTELVFKGYRVISDNEHKGAITLEAEADKIHCTVNCLPLPGSKTVISIAVYPKPL